MRLSLSFTDHPGRWVRAATAVLYSSAAGLLVLAAWAVASASAMRSELPELRERLAKSDSQGKAAVRKQEGEIALPPDNTLSALRQRVAGMNALMGGSGQPLLHHLALLEKFLPANARFLSLHHVSETGTLTLVVESESHEALALFLQNLEASRQYSEVLLLRQSQPGGRAGALRQFELRLRERV